MVDMMGIMMVGQMVVELVLRMAKMRVVERVDWLVVRSVASKVEQTVGC
jgi:hypothetical protein